MTDSSPTNHENNKNFPPPCRGRVRVGVSIRTYIPLTSILSRQGRGRIFYAIQTPNIQKEEVRLGDLNFGHWNFGYDLMIGVGDL